MLSNASDFESTLTQNSLSNATLTPTETLRKAQPFKPNCHKMLDDQDNPVMTPAYIKQLCKQHSLYSTPHLNDNLFLHLEGFVKIQALEAYVNLKSLWLEGNGIRCIENLQHLTMLKCLYLHDNVITSIQGLETLTLLDTVNLSNNLIRSIAPDCLSQLSHLSNLAISRNFLKTSDDLLGLLGCGASLTTLDLSFNKLDDVDIVSTILSQLPNLCVLNLMGNPLVSLLSPYRKTIISACPSLTFLDDRPVTDSERLLVNAWSVGGLDAERDELERQRAEKLQASVEQYQSMLRLQQSSLERRTPAYTGQNMEFSGDAATIFNGMLEKLENATLEQDAPEEQEESAENVPALDYDFQSTMKQVHGKQDMTTVEPLDAKQDLKIVELVENQDMDNLSLQD